MSTLSEKLLTPSTAYIAMWQNMFPKVQTYAELVTALRGSSVLSDLAHLEELRNSWSSISDLTTWSEALFARVGQDTASGDWNKLHYLDTLHGTGVATRYLDGGVTQITAELAIEVRTAVERLPLLGLELKLPLRWAERYSNVIKHKAEAGYFLLQLPEEFLAAHWRHLHRTNLIGNQRQQQVMRQAVQRSALGLHTLYFPAINSYLTIEQLAELLRDNTDQQLQLIMANGV